MPPPSPQKAHSRPSSGYEANGRNSHSLSGAASTPNQPHVSSRLSMSPASHHTAQPTLSYSPNTSFPPPSRPQQYQQAAGYSPTKPPSSSPLHSSSQHHATPSNSQLQGTHSSATPRANPSSNILRPSPGGTGRHMHVQQNMLSSPIPALPTDNTPLIPQKHDTPRPVSRDSIGDTPVFPPGVKMSPSPGTSFVRPASSSGPGASSLSFSQSFGHDGSGDVLSQQLHTRPTAEHPQPVPIPRRMSLSQHGELAEDGGIAGVETSLGVGSVPVKKMPPPSPSSSRLHFSPSALKSEDVIMKDP